MVKDLTGILVMVIPQQRGILFIYIQEPERLKSLLQSHRGNGLEDKASQTIEIYIPTLLEIEVVEYDTYISVPDASVYIYSSITDWEDQTNLETEGYTDEEMVL